MDRSTTHDARRLGSGGRAISAMGVGCWAIGGPFSVTGRPAGWGSVDDDESVRAIRRALDLGVTLFDTAAVYGCGHSERMLGRALGSDRQRVAIATKFGPTFDEAARNAEGIDVSPDGIREACRSSLRRLGTDHIDLFQLHIGDLPEAQLGPVRDVLEELAGSGWIGAYGWSTDNPASLREFAGSSCATVQAQLNLFSDAPGMLAACDDLDLTLIARTPLAYGLLTGKFSAASRLPADDVRGAGWDWYEGWFRDGRPLPQALAALEAIREILTSGGRTAAQGALGWIWARSERAIPIPGFKTVAQVEENAGALRHGPLTARDVAEIRQLLEGVASR